ncbi:hypothetical protein ACNHKD_02600 [Methylocystis sp. JAN1]|uniref:hypothetical protein n=1 Tax=Methylocystis sp. JAN1 TaxID=3397211 RepID=UPI003FA2D4E5
MAGSARLTGTASARVFGALAFGAALVAASGAAAFEGRYVAGSKGYAQDLVVAKRADGRFDVKADVATRGCAGEFEGAGALQGDALVAEAKFENEICALTLRRTKKGVSVMEDHCLSFHGAACEFSGDYRKR